MIWGYHYFQKHPFVAQVWMNLKMMWATIGACPANHESIDDLVDFFSLLGRIMNWLEQTHLIWTNNDISSEARPQICRFILGSRESLLLQKYQGKNTVIHSLAGGNFPLLIIPSLKWSGELLQFTGSALGFLGPPKRHQGRPCYSEDMWTLATFPT